jgi:predicted HTH transcriptional regulator
MPEQRYRLFVSSVQKELEIERVAVAGAISSDLLLSQWYEPVLYDREPLTGKKAAKPYLDCLATCQVYLMLLDRQYGHPKGTLSATHEEYRLAQKLSLPTLILVRGHHDADREKGAQDLFREIKDDGHTYRRFHDRVDLLPEVTEGLTRVLRDQLGVDLPPAEEASHDDVATASAFEQQELDLPGSALDLAEARKWLTALGQADAETCSQAEIFGRLRAKGLIRKEGRTAYRLRTAGLLFLGSDPASVYPQCRVFTDSYRGNEPDPRPSDYGVLSSPAPRIVEQVVEFVLANTRHPMRVVGIRRVQLDEYPRAAIREAVVNAVAHRDYEDAARQIQVKLFHDRLEVLSPGGPMRPLTLLKLRRGKYEPCSRNPLLAQYLNQVSLMDQRGRGLARMRDAMLNHGLAPPELSLREGYFLITLPGPGDDLDRLTVPAEFATPAAVTERLTDRQRQMAEMLAQGQTLTNRQCQELFGVSKVTAMKDLRALAEAGVATLVGQGRSARYTHNSENR